MRELRLYSSLCYRMYGSDLIMITLNAYLIQDVCCPSWLDFWHSSRARCKNGEQSSTFQIHNCRVSVSILVVRRCSVGRWDFHTVSDPNLSDYTYRTILIHYSFYIIYSPKSHTVYISNWWFSMNRHVLHYALLTICLRGLRFHVLDLWLIRCINSNTHASRSFNTFKKMYFRRGDFSCFKFLAYQTETV